MKNAKTSLYQKQIKANKSVKSLSGCIRYITKANDADVNDFLKDAGVAKKDITIDFVLNSMTERQRYRMDKAGNRIEPREKFTVWTVLDSIRRSTIKK